MVADLADRITAEGLYLAVSYHGIGNFGAPCHGSETIEEFRQRNVLSGRSGCRGNALYFDADGLTGTQGLGSPGKAVRQRSSGKADRIARFVERLPCTSGIFFYADAFRSRWASECGCPVQGNADSCESGNATSWSGHAAFRKLAGIAATVFHAKQPIGRSDKKPIAGKPDTGRFAYPQTASGQGIQAAAGSVPEYHLFVVWIGDRERGSGKIQAGNASEFGFERVRAGVSTAYPAAEDARSSRQDAQSVAGN